jgi:hypothetical protein
MKMCALAVSMSLPAVAAASAPVSFHLKATYVDARGQSHLLELWRDGNKLRRDTDGKLSLFVTHAVSGDDRYHVVDRARGFAYDARRANLIKIGSFSDWRSLTTLLATDHANATLTDAKEAVASTPVGGCRWRVGADRRVCWSDRWQLPLRIERRDASAGWRAVLTVDELQRGRPAASVLLPPHDLPVLDVDRDLSPAD